MKLRPFGNTGMNVSEIGLGAWQLANPDWGINDKNEALEIVQKSLEAGCNFFRHRARLRRRKKRGAAR